MNCPHCNIPLMGSMAVCPKCKYDTKKEFGGVAHIQWMLDHGETPNDQQLSAYPQFAEQMKAQIEAQKAQEKAQLEAQQAARDAYAKKQAEISSILISSGFNFDGYRIVKYSGYISGDDAVQIPRSGVFGGKNGQNLTDALVRIRQQALKELKEAAYDLGCNAVIGVDFDYITLEPETANITGGTLYEPYVICVTANGNAVVIEKE